MYTTTNPRSLASIQPATSTSDILPIQTSTLSPENTSQQPPRYSTITSTSITTSGNASTVAEGLGRSSSPPRYSSVFQPRSRLRGERTRSRRARTEQDRNAISSTSSGTQLHEYQITGGAKVKPWANLKIYGRSSASSSSALQGQKVPRFTGNDLVNGSLDLNLESPQSINTINLSLRGRVITSSYEDGACTFLDMPIVSWNRNNGNPRSMFSLPGEISAAAAARTRKFDGKFLGKYSWPFSFPFPETISLPGQQGQANIRSPSPQTFLERGTMGNVQYEIVLRITHGFLRADSKLYANIIYVPAIKPAPASILRQLAYSERLGLPGPVADPRGWCTLPSATVRGKAFGRSVKLECTLSISNPKTYTRGTVIPCHITIRCKDAHALDALACPDSLDARLVRRVQYYQDGGQSFLSNKLKQAPSAPVGVDARSTSTSGGILVDVAQVERAVWWENLDDGMDTNTAGVHSKDLTGEIHLDKDLQPSCEFSLFKVSYAIELIPFDSPVFSPSLSKTTIVQAEPKQGSSKFLISHPVVVATLSGEGPTPIPVTQAKPRKGRTVLRSSTEFNSGSNNNAMLDIFRIA